MTKYFTTNGRLVADLLASYSNTFVAFRELINNSLQAKATRIEIDITAVPVEDPSPTPLIQLSVRDNGDGVHIDHFEAKILDIATDDKVNGRGIGRFSGFQIGQRMYIETVGRLNERTSKTWIQIDAKEIEKSKLHEYPIEIHTEPSSEAPYYFVKIENLYDGEAIDRDARRRISKELLPENVGREIFLAYSKQILENKATFVVNGKTLQTNEYLVEPIVEKEVIYDRKGVQCPVTLSVIHYQANKSDVRIAYRTNNSGVLDQITEESLRIDVPDENGWLIFVDSEILNESHGLYRAIGVGRLDQEGTDFKIFTKQEIKSFFLEKYSEYYNFSKRLRSDSYFPYREKREASSSQIIAFSQVAFYLENEYKLLNKDNRLRKIIYPLIDLAINSGNLQSVLGYIGNMNADLLKKFRQLLERVDLEDVVEFSSDIVKKTYFLDLLYELVYSDISDKILERSQLHKILEKELWVFGEQYTHTPKLFSDKNLENNLNALRELYFSYDLTDDDENLIDVVNPKMKDITDLFFYNEKVLSDDRREVMVVELKAPRCAISQKELQQVDRYLYDIEKKGQFSKEIDYRIILVSSRLTGIAKSKVGQVDPSDPHLYAKSKSANITIHVFEWSELIHRNRRRLSYLGNALKVKDQEIKALVDREYSEYGLSEAFLAQAHDEEDS